MRVAAYLSGYPPDAGGGFTFENELFEGLVAAIEGGVSHRFSVICPRSAVDLISRRLSKCGIKTVALDRGLVHRGLTPVFREFSLVRAHWRRQSALDRAADSVGADFIWFLGAGAELTDRPFMTVVWDLQHRSTPWFPEFAARGTWDHRELWHSWFLRRAAVIVTGTRVGLSELERFYQIEPDRVAILPHPTPQFALDAAPGGTRQEIERLGLGARPYLLYPAQFWPHKNHVNLILALENLRSNHGLEYDLALVGSHKGNREMVERTARSAGLAERVHFLGFVSRPVLIELYRNAALLVYASWCGPENLPPLEAFALGCPVVASDIPGAREQLGDAAILVNPGDPASIADGVARLIFNPGLRASMIAKGNERARMWTVRDYVKGAIARIDAFEPVVRSWREIST
jgi:glycosyltransferase involved in cell wall biosynthesis